MSMALPAPDMLIANEAFIANHRASVGAARHRLQALQAAMDSTVDGLKKRCAEQLSALEAEAARRGRLEVCELP